MADNANKPSDPDYIPPPWPNTQAPGSEPPIVSADPVVIDPWQPVIALLSDDQLTLLNRESAARQAAAWDDFDERRR